MYGTEELLANLPDFERMKIRGGQSPYKEPVIPGEQRLTPEMQEMIDLRRRLGPGVKQAGISEIEFLNAYIPEMLAQFAAG